MKLLELKQKGLAPEWLTEEGYKTLTEGYLLPNETPVDLYRRVANSISSYLKKPELANKFYEYIYNNWLCLSTPVAANAGAPRGLPISCYSSHIDDTTDSIFQNLRENGLLIKYGGGIGIYYGDLRGRGAPISGGGQSDGIIGWLKLAETMLQVVSQNSVRRGAGACYLPINHLDADEFIDIRRPQGDLSRRCLSVNFHHGVTVDDKFMQEMMDGNQKNRQIWSKLLQTRVETGEPYIMFSDNANKDLPQAYLNNNLKVSASNLCSEIMLHTDANHTFVCCLSSVNLARWDEWKDHSTFIQDCIWFLDGVMEEFIQKAKKLPGFEKAVRFAEKGRALGLGALGFHTLLQQKMISFDSMDALLLNSTIFKYIKSEAEKATRELAKEYGEPEWNKGTGRRNTHLVAIAPTVSNSIISGGVSQGIEPIVANLYAQKSAKGTFVRKNPTLESYLEKTGRNTDDVWRQIADDMGSVKNVNCMTTEEKEVFATAREINQFSLVILASERQKYIDQGQSLNLFFSIPQEIQDPKIRADLGKYIHEVHMKAWELGLKSLYYCRTESVLRADRAFRVPESSDCKMCEG